MLASTLKYDQSRKRQQGQESHIENADFAISELEVIEFRSLERNEQTTFFQRPDVGMKLTKLCSTLLK